MIEISRKGLLVLVGLIVISGVSATPGDTCTTHSHCEAGEYCYNAGACSQCYDNNVCAIYGNSIDGDCSKCSTSTALAVTQITDSNFHSAIETCLGTNPVDGLCSSSEYGSMPDWDVSLVTDMSGFDGTSCQGFGNKTTFNGDIGSWNTEKVTDMDSMFTSAYAFNQDIGNWNTAQVNSMNGMFWAAFAFNQDIGNWNTAQVNSMNGMFREASAFNQDIGSWNTAQVTYMDSMFRDASAFNQDISSWIGTAATTAQTNMFSGATAFQAKYTCGTTGPASSCDTIESTWVAPSPPPSPPPPSPPPSVATPAGPLSSPATALTGLLGLISASVVAFVLV